MAGDSRAGLRHVSARKGTKQIFGLNGWGFPCGIETTKSSIPMHTATRLNGWGFLAGLRLFRQQVVNHRYYWLDGWGFPCGIETTISRRTDGRIEAAKWLGIPVRD